MIFNSVSLQCNGETCEQLQGELIAIIGVCEYRMCYVCMNSGKESAGKE